MGNCKDCRFWKHHNDHFKRKWNECEAVDLKDHYSDKLEKDDDFGVYAYASDDTGLNSGLLTGPMFGCIKFQPEV